MWDRFVLQAYLRDVVGLVLFNHNKVSVAIKGVIIFFAGGGVLPSICKNNICEVQ